MTRITPFTAVPSRQQSQEALVTSTNTFFSEVNGFVGQANQLICDINTAATNAIFTAPDWVAQAYESHKVVIYTDHNAYMSTEATISTDVPSVSAKWKKLNANTAGTYDMQVFTSSGTWTKPAGVSMVRIILCGGGGGGGAGAKSGTTVAQVGAGGGAGGGGGVCDVTIPASLFNATQSVTIGAGGSGGVGVNTGTAINGYTGKTGTSGGSTTFGTFTVSGGYGGNGGLYGQDRSVTSGQGGNSYIADMPDAAYPNPNSQATAYRRLFDGALSTASYYSADTSKTYHTVYGGCSTVGYLNRSSSPYEVVGGTPTSLFGGSSGGYGSGIYLSNGTSTRAIYVVGSINNPTKFLPSYFGGYATLGGAAGTASLTANATAGANATGYGAGGGGGGGCTENYTAGNGGNGSPGIAIIISW